MPEQLVFEDRCMKLFRLVLFVIVGWALPAYCDITISTPPSGGDTVAYCDDYFLNEWGYSLSMDGDSTGILQDIPSLQSREISNVAYSNGKLSFTTSSTSPLLSFLQYTVVGSIAVGTRYGEQHPIDSSTYTVFAIRMYASESTVAQLKWFQDYATSAITTFNVYEGWHTYRIDLTSASISSSTGTGYRWQDGNPTGLELLPANEANVSMQVDWVRLTTADGSCPSYTVNYTATPSGSDSFLGLYADTDTDPTNGIADVITRETASGAGSASLSTKKLFPGTSYYIYGFLSDDWATQYLLNPFDMSDSIDVLDIYQAQLSGATVSGGYFSATTTGTDPSFYLGIREGQTIPADSYPYISVGIEYTFPTGKTSDFFQIFFFDENGILVGNYSTTVTEGANILHFAPGSTYGWSGNISAVRIDPVGDADSTGTFFKLDFISFNRSGYVNSLTTPTPTTASGALTVNSISLSLLQPDKQGGRDYAQTRLGNAWNMNGSDDFSGIYNVSEAYIYPFNSLTDEAGDEQIGNFFYAKNISGNGDPNYISINYDGEINSEEFVNVCFRAWNDTEASGYNSVARILWQGDQNEPFQNGDDIVMTRGAQTYCVDMMTEIKVEPPLPDGSPNPWTSITGNDGGLVKYFRIDLNENEENDYWSVFDWITLRTDHEAPSSYAIVVSASLSQEVKLYYNTTKSDSGGTLIGTMPSGRNTNVYIWDTSSVTEGRYYIYATASSNGNTLSYVAPGRINIDHSLTPDSTPPILNCDRPGDGYEFDSQLELAGYALDETRLAAIEVFVDGAYFTSITPNTFNYEAATAYPNYAEANYPGFQVFKDASSISYGSHTVKIKATDTAGNSTSCTYSVTRQSGASTPAYSYPSPTGSAVSVDTDGITASPSLSISVENKKNVIFSISGTENCTSVTLYGAQDSSMSENLTTIYTGSGASSLSLNVENVKRWKRKKKKKKKKNKTTTNDGTLYFKAICSD
ncbi:MAG: hypothetical protein D6808_05235, partial [Candidatus Dadabacteria bacterium]